MDKYSDVTEKKFATKQCVGIELKERNARAMVEDNSNLIYVEVRNGMLPWLSEVSTDGTNIHVYRNQVNHNAITPKLSNEIAYNFLSNPIHADLKGKVHGRDMGTDMLCILTYNNNVSVNTALNFFFNLYKTFCNL